VRDKDLRKALLMGVDFSMTGRNKPVHGRFRHTSDKSRMTLPETPAKAGLFRPTFGFFREVIFNQIRNSGYQDACCLNPSKPPRRTETL